MNVSTDRSDALDRLASDLMRIERELNYRMERIIERLDATFEIGTGAGVADRINETTVVEGVDLDSMTPGTLLRDREEYWWYREPGDEWRVLPPHGDEASFTRPINKAFGPFTVVRRG